MTKKRTDQPGTLSLDLTKKELEIIKDCLALAIELRLVKGAMATQTATLLRKLISHRREFVGPSLKVRIEALEVGQLELKKLVEYHADQWKARRG